MFPFFIYNICISRSTHIFNRNIRILQKNLYQIAEQNENWRKMAKFKFKGPSTHGEESFDEDPT